MMQLLTNAHITGVKYQRDTVSTHYPMALLVIFTILQLIARMEASKARDKMVINSSAAHTPFELESRHNGNNLSVKVITV